MSVKNIKIYEEKFGDIAAEVQKAYPYVTFDDEIKKQIKEFTPQHSRGITYEITNANTALANGWRRVMLDEIVWPRLTCEMSDIRSDDVFNAKLTDYIQNRIWLIPTTYMKPRTGKHPDLQLSLDVKNMSQQNIIVRSSDIKWVKNKEEKDFLWDTDIDLCVLSPGRQIRINIGVEWGTNREHASFSNFHGIVYTPLTVPTGPFTKKGVQSAPLDFNKLPNSYSVHPDSYKLGFSCEAFVDPLTSAIMGWQTIREKLETAKNHITEFQAREKERGESAMPYITDLIKVNQSRGGIVRYEYMGETYTLTNILAWYAYKNDPDITNILAGDDHPEDFSGLVRIVHKNHSDILLQAAKDAISDVESIIKGLA